MNRKELTGDEALALIAKQREYQRKLKVGYEAAKKAGLIE